MGLNRAASILFVQLDESEGDVEDEIEEDEEEEEDEDEDEDDEDEDEAGVRPCCTASRLIPCRKHFLNRQY